MKRKTAGWIWLIVGVLITITLVACGGDEPDPASMTPSVNEVQTIEAVREEEAEATEQAIEAEAEGAEESEDGEERIEGIPDNLPVAIIAISSANVRSGPGTNFGVVTIVAQDEELPILGRNNNGSWLNVALADGQRVWVAASVVTVAVDVENIGIAGTVPAPSGSSNSGGGQVPTGGVCSCASNSLNCTDFGTQAQAQECYELCLGLVGTDIHGLDTDNNGEACKGL
ncbi:MAG TPA: SH3 domain-containing protein [Anaerolineae bacterium]|nr:SH3 domain-containing protein [Anaerolineae bacterium]